MVLPEEDLHVQVTGVGSGIQEKGWAGTHGHPQSTH